MSNSVVGVSSANEVMEVKLRSNTNVKKQKMNFFLNINPSQEIIESAFFYMKFIILVETLIPEKQVINSRKKETSDTDGS
ncbi:hypothetical protein JCM21714_3900 [Gracilibacillus boraciitolerans JCM 21714]|uniref:Uncharacterized protein n=1 Tax=Gracilibacillus boraciitolerans JCM 21714 TaxID=1298598 RepID=W4VNH8_9BACI|nr:hypothetical protein JCM21714_3900 [Gracilibacillus boraciitolerans JCM 21714]